MPHLTLWSHMVESIPRGCRFRHGPGPGCRDDVARTTPSDLSHRAPPAVMLVGERACGRLDIIRPSALHKGSNYTGGLRRIHPDAFHEEAITLGSWETTIPVPSLGEAVTLRPS